MKIDAIVWQAGKDLQDMEGLKRYVSPLQDDTAGTLDIAAGNLACLPSLLQTCIEDVKDAFVAVQNRTDTDAARWLLSNVGDWLSATMEGNGAYSWLPSLIFPVSAEENAMCERLAQRGVDVSALYDETAPLLPSLCGLLRDLQEWTAIQSTAPQSTRTPPREEGTQLPTIMGTPRETAYYTRAIECGYMERDGNRYEWVPKTQERWVYFMRLCYKNSDLQDADFKKQACRLFCMGTQPNKAFRTINNRYDNPDGKPYWAKKMDKDFADLQPHEFK